jgi:hypothetical protein
MPKKAPIESADESHSKPLEVTARDKCDDRVEMVIAGAKQIDVAAPETKEMENTDVDCLPYRTDIICLDYFSSLKIYRALLQKRVDE